DTRSTFMIRNIPNKYTQKMMIDLVNESHYRKFDFFYLRMDFINHCNCGYAFINFIDPKSVVPFAKRLVGRKWEKFNSDKVCSIRYADYQGKDRLVEHFRNSK
ncbi:RNA recognition motif 2, partial [Dimargaris cristalligena]